MKQALLPVLIGAFILVGCLQTYCTQRELEQYNSTLLSAVKADVGGFTGKRKTVVGNLLQDTNLQGLSIPKDNRIPNIVLLHQLNIAINGTLIGQNKSIFENAVAKTNSFPAIYAQFPNGIPQGLFTEGGQQGTHHLSTPYVVVSGTVEVAQWCKCKATGDVLSLQCENDPGCVVEMRIPLLVVDRIERAVCSSTDVQVPTD